MSESPDPTAGLSWPEAVKISEEEFRVMERRRTELADSEADPCAGPDQRIHDPDVAHEEMRAHYSAALDEIHRMRQAAAHEAGRLAVLLGYKSLPLRVRRDLESARQRLVLVARGATRDAYLGLGAPESGQRWLAEIGAPVTLTRSQWEASRG